MVRSWLFDRIGSGAKEAFPFMGIRCNRVVEGVFDRLTQRSTSDSSPQ
jgi:RNA polymerase sigma-70 factor (ECF subfamily)